MPSTPDQSRRSTTPRASSWPTGAGALGTGFFFALGHSTIIVVVGIGLSVAAKAVFGAVVDPSSGYEKRRRRWWARRWRPAFLYLIAVLNVVVLAGSFKVFRDSGPASSTKGELERQLQARGMMWRFFGRFMGSITKTWHMFFVRDRLRRRLRHSHGGSPARRHRAGAASQGLPWYAVLALPLLFSDAMTLLRHPRRLLHETSPTAGRSPARCRKVYYNLVITGLSVAVAFLIGTTRSSGCSPPSCHLRGGFWDFHGQLQHQPRRLVIAASFVVVWAAAIFVLEARQSSTCAGRQPHRVSPSCPRRALTSDRPLVIQVAVHRAHVRGKRTAAPVSGIRNGRPSWRGMTSPTLLRRPVVVAPMAGGPSTAELVIAAAGAGAVASSPPATRRRRPWPPRSPPSVPGTAEPFGVNVFVPGCASATPEAVAAYLESLAGDCEAVVARSARQHGTRITSTRRSPSC